MQFSKGWVIILVIIIPLANYLLIKILIDQQFNEKRYFQLKTSLFRRRKTTQHPTNHTRTTTNKPRRIEVGGCKLITDSDLSKVKTTKYGIPLILHQLFKDHMLPVQYITFVKGCRKVNPDFVFLLWTDNMIAQFLNQKYPQYKSLFSKYGPIVTRSDFFRILLLHHFGGVYLDLDVECKKPLSKELDKFNSSAILDQERWLQTRLIWNRNNTAMNSAMMARKGHPFFKYMLDRFSGLLTYKHDMWRTGPFALHIAYTEYQRQENLSPANRVFLAPATAFSPILDPKSKRLFDRRCRGNISKMKTILRLGCEEWSNKHKRRIDTDPKIVSNAILIHHFLHLAYPYFRSGIKKRQNVCQEVRDIHLFVI